MGTPLLSRPGMLFASRVASSILSSLGQTQLIARNEEDFVEVGKRLIAGQRGRELRRKLRADLEMSRWTSSLYNTRLGVRKLEVACSLMWELYYAERTDMHIIVL